MDETELKHALEPLDGRKVGTILHIGAGLCPDLAAYTTLAASSVVLLEPNPTLAEGLQAQIDRLPDSLPDSLVDSLVDVQIYPMALAGQDGTNPFHIYALPDLSGLSKPTALLQSYPGLTENSVSIDVPCLSVPTLLKKVKLSKHQENWLILEADGVEQDLVGGLVSKAGTALFDRLLIRLSPSRMYETSLGARKVLARLTASGYILQDAWGSEDPDWLWFQLGPDLLAIKQATADRAAISALETELANLKKTLQTTLQEHDKTRLATEATTKATALAAAKVADKTHAKLQQALTQSHEEMLKAEGQIALLKDVLLSGSEK